LGRIDHYGDPDAPAANSLVPSVTAVVRRPDGTLLLVRRSDNGLWALPGGAVDIGESVSQAVTREVEEETGILVRVVGLVGIYSDPRHVIVYDDGEARQQFSLCFTTEVLGGSLRTSPETSQVLFVGPQDLDELEIHPSMRLRIAHGLDLGRRTPHIG
jgi:ADP-ribose pyrophosphatase YjhB (NUDIX family)